MDNTGANAELVKALLEPLGYEVLVGCNMAEGERLALEHRPRLILCDVHIGEESGYDFIGRVRARAALAAIPFVFLSSTAWHQGQNVRRSREAGAADFIQRPIDPQEFVARVKASMQGGRSWQPS